MEVRVHDDGEVQSNSYAFTNNGSLIEHKVRDACVVSASSEWHRYPHISIDPSSTPTINHHDEDDDNYQSNNINNHTIISDETVCARPRRHWLCGNAVLIEIVCFLYVCSMYTLLPVIQYYVIYRIWKANPEDDKSEVLDKAASMNIRLSLASNLVAVVPTIFFGVLADRFGRKVVMLITVLGSLARSTLCCILIHFETRLEFLYIANALEGICGSYGTFFMGMFGMVADITAPGQQRDIRTTIVSASIFVASAVGTTSSGFWTRYIGYESPLIFSSAILGLASFLLIVIIPETVRQADRPDLSLKAFSRFLRIFTVESNNRTRKILLLCLFIFFVTNYNLQANNNTIILYLEGGPFQWKDDKIAVFGGLYSLCSWIAIIIVSILFRHCVKDVTFAIIGTLTSIVGLTVQGLASNDYMMYTSAVMSLLSPHALPMMRSIMSRHVPASEQGSMFSGVAVMEMICGTLAGVTASYLYKFGLHYYYGLHSLVLAGCAFIAFVATVILRFSLVRNARYIQQQ